MNNPKAVATDMVSPPSLPSSARLAELAKALSHPARIEIIQTLMRRERCVGCDIVEEIGLAQSTTSEHLRILKAAGLIIGMLERPYMCYTLNPEALAPLAHFLTLLRAHRPCPPLERQQADGIAPTVNREKSR